MRHFFYAALLGGMAGCVNLLPPAPSPAKVVSLQPILGQIAPNTSSSTVDWSLLVEKPLAPTLYDSRRLFVQTKNDAGLVCLEPLAGLEWDERLPALLQQHLVRAFQQTGRILGVGTEVEDFQSQYTLQLSLHRVYVALEAAGCQHLQLELSAKLIDQKTRRVVAQAPFDKIIDISHRNARHFVEAYQQGFAALLKDMVAWTFEQRLSGGKG